MMTENTVFATSAKDSCGRDIMLTEKEREYLKNRKKKKRYVGLFYFLWVGQQGEKHTDVYDIEKLLKSNPEALWNTEGCSESPLYMNYFFSEPLFGYYNMADPYILRKHIELFIAADIDFLVFDYTNAIVYENVWPKLLELLEEYRLDGWNVPKFTFMAKTKSDYVVSYVYEHIHSKNIYPELWFYGPYDKPLIIAPKESITEEQSNFYHVRDPQWPNEERDNAAFPYVDWTRPQTVYEDVMSVSVAQHTAGAFSFSEKMLNFACGTENKGRGYSDLTGENRKDDINKCVNFTEQWEHAIKTDPDIVFVTGWNEWTALKLKSDADLSAPLWVDTFNVEYSRDIEMTKGYYDDNYYLQLIKQVRRYKGVPEISVWAPDNTLPVYNDSSQWANVKCAVYRAISAKPFSRDFIGYIPDIHYTQAAPANFIRVVRAAHDKENMYFCIETDTDITPFSESKNNRMNIFIGTEKEEFEYVLNRISYGSVERVVKRGEFVRQHDVPCSVTGKYMQLAIPLADIGVKCDSFGIRFKVADSVENPDNIMDYYVSGSTLPLGRMSYLYGSYFK